jgi:hypothetical protein
VNEQGRAEEHTRNEADENEQRRERSHDVEAGLTGTTVKRAAEG